MNIYLCRIFCVGVFLLGFLSTANASLFPIEVGGTWTYLRTDGNSASWNVEVAIIEEVTLGSNQYFRYSRFNYNNAGATQEAFVRATIDTVYFWEIGTGELALFRANEPVGTIWIVGDDEYERMSDESIHVPYFGQDELMNEIFHLAVVFRVRNVVENSPFWYEYFVPNIGWVREIDEWSNVPPATMELVSIEEPTTMSIPVPAFAIIFLGFTLAAIKYHRYHR